MNANSDGIKMETLLGKCCLAVWKQAFAVQFESVKTLPAKQYFRRKQCFCLPLKEDTFGLKKKKSAS